MTPRSSAITRQPAAARARAASNGARPGPARPAPARGVARARRHRPVGAEGAEVVDAREVEELEGAAQALDPPAVAPVAQRAPVVDRVAPQLALGGEGVGRDAGHDVVAEELGLAHVVGAAGRDVDGHVADQAHAALVGVHAQCRPLAVEAHLVVDAPACRRRRPPSRRSRTRGARGTPRARPPTPARRDRPGTRATQRKPTTPCRASPGDWAARAAAPATTTGPPPRASRRTAAPVRQASRPASEVRCSCTPLVRGSRMWERGVDVPARAKAKSPSRIRIAYPSPTVDCGRWPVKRTVADTVQVSADIFRDGHEVLRAVVRWREPGSKRWREAPLIPVDAHHNGVRWEGAFTVEKPGRTQWNIQAWVDLFAGWRDELARKVEFGQPDLSGELSEGAVLLRAAADRAKGEDKRAPDRGRRGDRHRSARRARPRAARARRVGPGAHRGHRAARATSRSTSTARWRASAPGTSSSRARGAASRASRSRSRGIAELGFDVLYMPPIHPIGHTNRKGRNNTLTRRARRSRQPVRDRRRDRRPRRDPPRARHRRGVPRARRDGGRARHRRRPRPRDQLLARPPVAQGAPRVVLPPPRRHAQVRREPAQEVPGHLQRQLRLRRLARRCGTRCWPSCATGSTAA